MSIEQVRILIHSDAMTAKLMKKKKKTNLQQKDEGKAVLWIRMFIIFQLLTHIELKDALQHIVTWFQVAAQP